MHPFIQVFHSTASVVPGTDWAGWPTVSRASRMSLRENEKTANELIPVNP
jgi:hypothetical protein